VELMHTEVIIIKAIEVKNKTKKNSISGGPLWPGGPQHVLKVLHGKSGPGPSLLVETRVKSLDHYIRPIFATC